MPTAAQQQARKRALQESGLCRDCASPASAGRVRCAACLTKNRNGGHNADGLYSVWRSMILRCHHPAHGAYESYGAKGVSVCHEWRKSFEVFRTWASANGYRDGLTIDRRRASDNYSPDTCRFATYTQQAVNRRSYRPTRNTRLNPFRGVDRTDARKFRAQIRIGGKKKSLGVFGTALTAALAYDDAAFDEYGEFALLNFPERKRKQESGSQGLARKQVAGAT